MSAKWKEDLEAIGQMMDTMREENANLRKHAEEMKECARKWRSRFAGWLLGKPRWICGTSMNKTR